MIHEDKSAMLSGRTEVEMSIMLLHWLYYSCRSCRGSGNADRPDSRSSRCSPTGILVALELHLLYSRTSPLNLYLYNLTTLSSYFLPLSLISRLSHLNLPLESQPALTALFTHLWRWPVRFGSRIIPLEP